MDRNGYGERSNLFNMKVSEIIKGLIINFNPSKNFTIGFETRWVVYCFEVRTFDVECCAGLLDGKGVLMIPFCFLTGANKCNNCFSNNLYKCIPE